MRVRGDRTGLLFVTVWTHGDRHPPELIARVTTVLDVTRAERSECVVRDPEEVFRLVREWLDAFSAARGGDEEPAGER